MKSINPKDLTGEDLFYYMTNDYPDKDYSKTIEMLPYALADMEKVYSLLERSIKEEKTFIVVYPGDNEKATDDLEYIGDVMDGAIYLK